jgi:hypothetical protein
MSKDKEITKIWEEEVKIPIEWLERLIQLNDQCKGIEPEEIRKESQMLLHGYIESAKYFIKSNSLN